MQTTQSATLSTMSLKDIAALCGTPSIAKMSKDKAVARATKILAERTAAKLEAMLATPKIDQRAVTPKADAAKPAKAKKDKTAKAATAPKDATAPKRNKHSDLTDALATGGTREQLMAASGFDNKNLSVAMCNLKRAGYVIGIEEKDVAGVKTRFYQLVDEKRTTAH